MLGRWIAWPVAVLLIMLTGACGNNAADRDGGPLAGNPAESTALPALPAGPALDLSGAIPKRALIEEELALTGSEYFQKSANTTVVGEELHLNPAPGELAWAVFRYEDIAPYYRVDALQLLTQDSSGLKPTPGFHVGFANYDKNRWELLPSPLPNPLNGQSYDALTVASPEGLFYPYSPDGHAYVAVIAFDNALRVGMAVLFADEAAPPPLGVAATQGTVDGGITISWIDPAISFDPDGDRPGVYEYEGVQIERYNDSLGGWQMQGEVPSGVTSYTDTYHGLESGVTYQYRVRTVFTDPFPGRPSKVVTGQLGMRPVAEFTFTDHGATATLDASASHDPDNTDVINEYRWTVSYPQDQGFKYDFTSQENTYVYIWSDRTKINRFDLQVLDNEGLLSEDFDSDASGFYLWSPNDGCVQDDPDQPDPKDTVTGYSVTLNFTITCGSANYRIDLDSHFNGVFGSNDGIPTIQLKDSGTPPNHDGDWSLTADIPAAQFKGEYYFALRVTDESQNYEYFMWPDKVVLPPAP